MKHLAPRPSVEYDPVLILLLVGFLLFSIVLVYSASVEIAASSNYTGYDSKYFLKRQFAFVGIALVSLWIITRIGSDFWRSSWSYVFMTLMLGALILVLIPGIGREVNGASRWIALPGIGNFQPSEMTKFALAIFMSYFISKNDPNSKFISTQAYVKRTMPLAVLVGVICGLLLAEPDLGSTVVVVLMVVCALFLAGIPLKLFFGVLALLSIAFYFLVVTSEYRLARVMFFMNPWSDEFGNGYQLTHSLIAIGRGGLFGQGLGASIEKANFLPEANTDFIFAVFAEEFGFVGVITLIGAYLTFVLKLTNVAMVCTKHSRKFQAIYVFSIASWIGLQAVFNLGVCMGLLPTKGLTLPMLSFGGSSLITMCLALGLCLRIDAENRAMFGVQRA